MPLPLLTYPTGNGILASVVGWLNGWGSHFTIGCTFGKNDGNGNNDNNNSDTDEGRKEWGKPRGCWRKSQCSSWCIKICGKRFPRKRLFFAGRSKSSGELFYV